MLMLTHECGVKFSKQLTVYQVVYACELSLMPLELSAYKCIFLVYGYVSHAA